MVYVVTFIWTHLDISATIAIWKKIKANMVLEGKVLWTCVDCQATFATSIFFSYVHFFLEKIYKNNGGEGGLTD